MGHPTAPVTILHVDDDPAFLELSATVLEREDDRFRVVCETDPRAAIDRLADEAPDCVVADYDMSGVDGLALLDAVRDTHPELPYVLFTGKGSEEVASEAISAGVTDYLQKEPGASQFAVLANRVRNAVSRHRAEGDLAAVRRRYELVTDVATDAFFDYDLVADVVDRSKGFFEAFGYEAPGDEADSLDWYLERIHPDDREAIWDVPERAMAAGETRYEDGHRLRLADGSYAHLEVRGRVVYEEGEPVRIIGALTDVTERERRERELHETARRFDLALEATDTGLWEWNLATDEVVWNEHLERLLGIQPGGFEGTFEAYADYLHPADEAQVARGVEAAVEETGEFHETFRMVRTDGEVRWVEGHGRVFSADGTDRMVGLTTDVTDLERAEQALSDSEERYQRLLATAPTPIFVYSTDGPLRYANDAVLDFLEADDVDEVLGTAIGDFTHPDSGPLVEERRRRLVEDREPVPPAEQQLVDLDGERKHAILASAPVTYDGEPAIQTVATDITSVKRREAELERQIARLDAFASIVSHDLRNPLNVAMGRVDLAREDRPSEDLDRALDALHRMERLVEDLLTFARDGEEVREPEPVDLEALASACWRTVATGDAVLEVTTPPTVRADRSRLHQALENLFRNAVEHGGPDVTVTVGGLEDGFYVEDDGVGIEADRREAVFEHGHSTAERGSGFGLAIVEQVVEAHDWTVRVTEGAAGGARFECSDVELVDPTG